MDFSLYFFSATGKDSYAKRYSFLLEAAKYIDANGYKAIWTPERHFQEFGGSFPNPSVLSAALATVTKNIELRAGSIVLPLHHPIRVVEEWSLVDQLSNGRTALCVATGWHRADFVLNPNGYANRRDLAFEGVQILRDLWEGKTVEFTGVDGQVIPIRTYPRPVRSTLPIWLVFSQNPETWKKAGELGANMLCLLDNFDRLRQNIAIYREERAKHGFHPDEGIVTVGIHTFIGDDDTKVKALVKEPVMAYLETFLQQRKTDAGLQGESKKMSEAEKSMLSALAFDDMYEKRSLLGTMDKCENLVRRLKEIGVNEIAALVDFGLEFDVILDGLRRLTELKDRITKEDKLVAADSARNQMDWYYNRTLISN